MKQTITVVLLIVLASLGLSGAVPYGKEINNGEIKILGSLFTRASLPAVLQNLGPVSNNIQLFIGTKDKSVVGFKYEISLTTDKTTIVKSGFVDVSLRGGTFSCLLIIPVAGEPVISKLLILPVKGDEPVVFE